MLVTFGEIPLCRIVFSIFKIYKSNLDISLPLIELLQNFPQSEYVFSCSSPLLNPAYSFPRVVFRKSLYREKVVPAN